MFEEWRRVNDTEEFAIYGTNMGWRRQSGHTGRMTTFDELIQKMMGFECRIEWTFNEDDKTFEMVRRSHDEMGACFEVVPWNEGDDE
jgi:hypothetical protein